MGQDLLPDGTTVEGPWPTVLATVVAGRPLSQGRDVMLDTRRHVLPGHRQPIQDPVAVALPEQQRPVGHAPPVQQPAGHHDARHHRLHKGVPVDQGGVPSGDQVRMRMCGRLRMMRSTG